MQWFVMTGKYNSRKYPHYCKWGGFTSNYYLPVITNHCTESHRLRREEGNRPEGNCVPCKVRDRQAIMSKS